VSDQLPDGYTPDTSDLTPEEAAERDRTARLLDGQILDCVRVGRAALWELAKRLHEFDEESGWLGLGYGSRAAWLADRPELDMSDRTCRRWIKAWRDFGCKAPVSILASVDLSKVDVILPAVKEHRVRMAKALEDAKSLPLSELRQLYSQPRALANVGQPGEVATSGHFEPDKTPPVAPSPDPQPVEAARLASEEPPLDWGEPTIVDPHADVDEHVLVDHQDAAPTPTQASTSPALGEALSEAEMALHTYTFSAVHVALERLIEVVRQELPV